MRPRAFVAPKKALSRNAPLLGQAQADADRFSGKIPMAIGLILLPSLVFFLYVGAYYQPLDNMKNTPVLIVNMDGSENSYQIENAITSTNVYEFRRASLEYAQQSVADGSEWAAIVIPADFTDRLDRGEDAQISLLVDDSRSYVVTRVLSPTITAISDRVNARLRETSSERIGEGLSLASSQERLTSFQLSSAGKSSSQIAQGQWQLATYTSTASVYTGEMSTAGKSIAYGLKTAALSADSLRAGLVTLHDGSSNLSSGLLALRNGTSAATTAHASLDSALSQSIAVAGTLDNSTAKTTLLYMLNSAKNGSSLEYAGLVQIDSAASRLYSGSLAVTSGLSSAVSGTATLETGLFTLQRAQTRLSSSMGDSQLSLSRMADSQGEAAAGSARLSSGLFALSGKQGAVSSALLEASGASYSPPSIRITVHDANKSDYGTFFATAFVVLGLFFGAASAYLFCALTHAKRALPYAAAFCLAQVLVLLAVYLSMGFPARSGAESLFIVFAFVSATFLAMTRAITYLLGDIFTSEHLQIMSPVLSLLAVFMISSSGAIWPQHTLNWPFSLFAPYIPFNYATAAIRSNAIVGAWPEGSLLALLAFCAVFYLIRKLAAWWHAGGKFILLPLARRR